jgi:hypothetical protein
MREVLAFAWEIIGVVDAINLQVLAKVDGGA